MREIVPGVLTWPWWSERHGYDFNGFLVRDPGGNVCIDPVEPGEADMDALVREGVARILLTNRNHVRAASRVRAATGARVAIHPADAAHARGQGATIDDELAAGAVVGPLAVIGVPGKSPGEVALHWPARRLLIVGDAIVGNPPGACALLPDRVMDDPRALRTSVRVLLALDFDTLLVGDGAPIVRGAKERLRELVATFGGR
jgi:glyoxylase-like metal-dependent hydrolase (beta-lactamase superfamily II)